MTAPVDFSAASLSLYAMDPLTAATIFSTIVALIAEFRSQRHSDVGDQYEEFASWLSENRHKELLSLLQMNVNTTLSIKWLLSVNRKVLEERLEVLDRAMVRFPALWTDFPSSHLLSDPTPACRSRPYPS